MSATGNHLSKKNDRTCGQVTPVGLKGIATAGTLSALKKILRFRRTANENDMRLSAVVCTANIAGVADGEWGLIAPYGEHPSPDGSYSQKFDRPQADKVVATWNSITGKAARVFKNMWHGLGAKFSSPVWEGHPETSGRSSGEKLLAEVTDVRSGTSGLEGRVTWNAKGTAARKNGPLYPSPLWWHLPPAGEPPTVYPELLESIGLVPNPNISSVPAWTQNATLAGHPEENQNHMNHRDQIIALLGLKSDATDAAIQSSLDAHSAKVTSTANSLATVTTEKSELETKLSTANGQVTTLTTERDTLKTANSGLTTEVAALQKGVLDLAEKKGIITAAERPDFTTRITTANTRDAALTDLQTRKPALNTTPVELNGNRVDLSTANSRASVLETAIAKRMDADKCDRTTAYTRVKADATFAPLFAAMKQPETASK